MRNKAIAGFIVLGVGMLLTGVGYQQKLAVSADSMTGGTVQRISVTLFLGIALIIFSAILFIMASGSKKRDRT